MCIRDRDTPLDALNRDLPCDLLHRDVVRDLDQEIGVGLVDLALVHFLRREDLLWPVVRKVGLAALELFLNRL